MPRKSSFVTIKEEGRDEDKVFYIQEMSASQAESWAMRVFLALAKAGVEIPENIASAGLSGVAFLSLKALGGLRYEDAKPLLDEMMACVQAVPNPTNLEIRRSLHETDIEEVKTILKLRSAVIELHTGFSLGGALSKASTSMQVTPPQ